MTAIINNNGEIQENTPYQTIEDLIAYGLTDYRFATDDEIKTYNENKAKEAHNTDIYTKINALEATQTRALREMLVSPNDFAKNKLLEIDNQITELRKQLL